MRQELPVFIKYITFTVFTQPVIDTVAFRRELEMQWLDQYKAYFFVPSSPEDRQSEVGRSLNSEVTQGSWFLLSTSAIISPMLLLIHWIKANSPVPHMHLAHKGEGKWGRGVKQVPLEEVIWELYAGLLLTFPWRQFSHLVMPSHKENWKI